MGTFGVGHRVWGGWAGVQAEEVALAAPGKGGGPTFLRVLGFPQTHCPSTHRPMLIDMSRVYRQSNLENLDQAFTVAERDLGVTRLLDPEGELGGSLCRAPSLPTTVSPT